MDPQPSPTVPLSAFAAAERSTPADLSAAGAISYALDDTLGLLFRPFHGWKWARLGMLCLLLGSGPPTAAFQWGLGAIPTEYRLPDLLNHARLFLSAHPSLIFLAIAATLALGLVFLYLRSVFRFLLVDSLVRMEVTLRQAWPAIRPLGRSYFRWLAGTLAGLAAAFSLMVIAALSGVRAAPSSGPGKLFATASLALILSLIVLLGLAAGLLIMLSDDLAVPLMYADRLSLAAAWRDLWRKMRRDPASFAVYILLRFVLSVGVSVAVLLFLVPLLVGVFSAAVIVAATVVLALHLVGLTWVWNVATVALASLALAGFIAVLLILLGLVGMPGQVFLQDFSLRFIAARSPSLNALCATSEGEKLS